MKKILSITLFCMLIAQGYGQKLPFQGKLIEAGLPVNDPKTLEFGIPDLEWSETHTDVQVTDGLYFVVLGSINPLPANIFSDTNERQLELSVDGTALSPVTLYKPLSGDLSQLNVKGPGNGIISGGFGTGSAVKENLPYLKLNGNMKTIFNRISMEVSSNNDNTVESGNIYLNSSNGVFTAVSPGYFALNSNNLYNMQLFSQNWGNRGHAGTILLRGPNNNLLFEIGNRHWENANLPRIQMRGSTENPVIELSASNDENETGFIGLQSKNNRFAFLNTNTLFFDSQSKRMITIESANWGNGDFGLARLHGNQSHLSFMNSNDQEKINLGIGDWGNGSSGQLHLRGVNSNVMIYNADNVPKGFLGMAGNDNNNTMLRLAGNDAHIALSKELFSPNPPIVFIDIENNGNGDYGRFILMGPSSSNIVMGGAGKPDLPTVVLKGSQDQETVILGCTDDEEERGFIILKNKNNSEQMSLTSNAIGGNTVLNIWNGLNVENGATITGNLQVNGDISCTGTFPSSDQRLKKDIQPLGNNILGKIKSLEGVSYSWRKDEFPKKNFSADQQIGLLAQELEEQFPALVKTGDDGFKSVNYNGFTAVLLEAVKELNSKVEKLESENRLLQAELSASAINKTELEELKSQMDVLVKMVQNKSDSSSELDIAETNSSNNIK